MRINSPIARTAFRAVRKTFGETVRVVPMVQSEYAEGIADQERPVKDIDAIVTLTPSVEDFSGARDTGKIRTMTRLSSREASVWIAPEIYATIGYDLREGDGVVLVDRGNEPFIISRVGEPSDRGDFVLNIVQDGNK